MAADPVLRHDTADHQYVALIDDRVAALTVYQPHPDVWDFIHTETEPGLEHHGLATHVVKFALDDVGHLGLHVRPFCPFVRQFIADHAGYLNLVRAADRAQFNLPPSS